MILAVRAYAFYDARYAVKISNVFIAFYYLKGLTFLFFSPNNNYREEIRVNLRRKIDKVGKGAREIWQLILLHP